jgi:hypothetical protein
VKAANAKSAIVTQQTGQRAGGSPCSEDSTDYELDEMEGTGNEIRLSPVPRSEPIPIPKPKRKKQDWVCL